MCKRARRMATAYTCRVVGWDRHGFVVEIRLSLTERLPAQVRAWLVPHVQFGLAKRPPDVQAA